MIGVRQGLPDVSPLLVHTDEQAGQGGFVVGVADVAHLKVILDRPGPTRVDGGLVSVRDSPHDHGLDGHPGFLDGQEPMLAVKQATRVGNDDARTVEAPLIVPERCGDPVLVSPVDLAVVLVHVQDVAGVLGADGDDIDQNAGDGGWLHGEAFLVGCEVKIGVCGC